MLVRAKDDLVSNKTHLNQNRTKDSQGRKRKSYALKIDLSTAYKYCEKPGLNTKVWPPTEDSVKASPLPRCLPLLMAVTGTL